MTSTTPLRVAVIGGGLGGLSLALVIKTYLNDKALTLDIYETAPKFAEIGAGVSAWNRTCWIFGQIGLDDLLQKRIAEPIVFRKSDTAQDPFRFHTLVPPYGSLALPRVEILNKLVDVIKPEETSFMKTHFSKKLISYDKTTAEILMHFEDGSSASADIIIGADGLGSATRKTMYTNLAERGRPSSQKAADALLKLVPPTWTGLYAYRALVDLDTVKSLARDKTLFTNYMMWCGSGQHAVTYPISPTTLNVLFFTTEPDGFGKPLTTASVSTATREEILRDYQDWDPDLRMVAEQVTQTSKWAISDVRDLPTYVDGRTALLGDSAHAMTTHLGAGAGQAIEGSGDAYILGRVLTHPLVNRDNIVEALKVYDTIRRPFANEVCRRSLRLGFLYDLRPEYLPENVDVDKLRAGDREELLKVADDIEEIWSIHFKALPGADWERASEMLGNIGCGDESSDGARRGN